MTREEILEGNRLIVNFMGIRPVYNSYTGTFQWSDGVFFATGDILYEEAMNNIVKYVKYSASWDWIMPVVDAIETRSMGIYQVDILQEGCKIKNRCKSYIDKTVSKVPEGTTKLESVWMAIVEFIKDVNKK